MSKTIEVQLLGKSFNFNLPEDLKPEEFLEIINYVQNKLHLIRSGTVDLDFYKLALLTSVNIAEELFTLKKEYRNIHSILDKIDSAVTPVITDSSEADDEKFPINFSS